MSMTSTERSRALRERRKAKGLKQISFWVTPKDEELARKIISPFEKIALQEETEIREKLRQETLANYINEWKTWLKARPNPKTQKVSSQQQRLEAYRVARALGTDMPDEVTFSDHYLLRDWITKQKQQKYEKAQTGLVEKFIFEQEK